MPFGNRITSSAHRFVVRIRNREEPRLLAVPLTSRMRRDEIVIHPPYRRHVVIPNPRNSQRLNLEVWAVTSEPDRVAAQTIVARSHYRPRLQRGFIVGCRFLDSVEQRHVRRRSARHPSDKWSPAWTDPPGSMVACAVLDTLLFGRPRGRVYAIRDLMHASVPEDWSRSRVVSHFRIAWASRFAVDAPYRGLGLGTLLARHLKLVAKQYRAPVPSMIEVITTITASGSDGKITLPPLSHDFLCKAGYTRIPTLYPCPPVLLRDPATGKRTVRRRARKAYYYVRIP